MLKQARVYESSLGYCNLYCNECNINKRDRLRGRLMEKKCRQCSSKDSLGNYYKKKGKDNFWKYCYSKEFKMGKISNSKIDDVIGRCLRLKLSKSKIMSMKFLNCCKWLDKEERRKKLSVGRYYAQLRYKRVKQATPRWADMERIKEIYDSCPEGFHVDHIIPLTSKIVCGLHVENNLQLLPSKENLDKSNYFNPDLIN